MARKKKPEIQVEKKERLGNDEIVKLVNRIRDHDRDKDFVLLQEQLKHYITAFTKNYTISGCDEDEIRQECLYALRYKAIEDFDQNRGVFKSFAVLCMRRHLFSIIKGNNQLKRKALNTCISLDEDRSDDGENISLASTVPQKGQSSDNEVVRSEGHLIKKEKLLSKLSKLEQEVLKLYLQQMHYDEIVKALREIFPGKRLSKKSIDNALVRCRLKAQSLAKNMDWSDTGTKKRRQTKHRKLGD